MKVRLWHAPVFDWLIPNSRRQAVVVFIAKTLAGAGIQVFLFDQPWNRDLAGDRITRVHGWTELAQHLGL